MNLFGKKFRFTLLLIFLAEIFSLFGYLLPIFNNIAFFIIVLLCLVLAIIKLEYGVYVIFVELFIGSLGYLFSFSLGNNNISVRIALWLIIMSIWLVKSIINVIKTKRISLPIFKSSYFKYFLLFFAFIIWAFANGILNKNSLHDVFFDFNGWLYFTLIFPVYDVFNPTESSERNNKISGFMQIFTACLAWLTFETFFLLFAFSHGLTGIIESLYHWVRDTGVGEITQMQGGFYRIFFQSHIYVLIGFFIFLLLALNYNKNEKIYKTKSLNYWLFSILLLAVNIISFSRSNWIGLIAGLAAVSMIFIYQKKWRKLGLLVLLVFINLIVSLGLIVLIAKFPYPSATANFNTADLLSERASDISSESGVSSRWSLLPKLFAKIESGPVLGKGYGTTVTYQSKDPRILAANPTGEYTTYAFEWGWLDIWLKLGILGLLSYFLLLYIIIFKNIRKNTNLDDDKQIINFSLLLGLFIIIAVSFFSPYMNHPLGIGYLILLGAIF
jgi:O-antigen ligase